MEHKSRNELMTLIKRHGLTSKVEREVQKMISVLIPFLKKYNIVIDERK